MGSEYKRAVSGVWGVCSADECEKLMIDDAELIKDLNFISGQPTWVYHELANEDMVNLLRLQRVPYQTGIYWIAGESTLASGKRLGSVFRVDSDAGGSLATVYWKINDMWFRHDDTAALEALGLVKNDVFPFDWSFAVPLEEDHFHD